MPSLGEFNTRSQVMKPPTRPQAARDEIGKQESYA